MQFQTFINAEKYTVVVKIVNPIKEYREEYRNFLKSHNRYIDREIFDEFLNLYEKQINDIVGIATCNVEAGDIFDEKYGEALAYERCLKAFETYRIKMYRMIEEDFEKVVLAANKKVAVCSKRKTERAERIHAIIAGVS